MLYNENKKGALCTIKGSLIYKDGTKKDVLEIATDREEYNVGYILNEFESLAVRFELDDVTTLLRSIFNQIGVDGYQDNKDYKFFNLDNAKYLIIDESIVLNLYRINDQIIKDLAYQYKISYDDIMRKIAKIDGKSEYNNCCLRINEILKIDLEEKEYDITRTIIE